MIRPRPTLAGAAALALLLAACGGGGTEPSVASSVVAVSANPLTAAVIGTTIASAPTFEVRDARGKALSGIAVSVAVTAGGGTLAGAPTVSLAGPTPIGQWTLGTGAGEQSVTVTAPNLAPLVFTVNALAGPPAQLAIVDGDDQFGTKSQPTFLPLRVRARDQFNNVVGGATVNWVVDAGGGTLAAATSVTDANGIAVAPTWTLGGADGEQAVVASVGALSARFTVTAQNAPATLEIVTGAPASATVFTEIAPAPSFVVRDAGAVALQGIPVTVTTSAGTVTGAPSVSAPGTTSVGTWKLGTTAGTQTLTISVPGLAPQVLTVTATPGAPAVLQLLQGGNQIALAGATLPAEIRARLTDQFGNRIAGQVVTWAIASGGGTLTGAASAATDANGAVTAPAWTLGRRGGVQTLRAAAGGVTLDVLAVIQSAFRIDLRWAATAPTGAIAAAFAEAADRISAMVIGDISDVQIGSAATPFDVSQCNSAITGVTLNEVVDDVLIYARVDSIDGPGRVLGSAGPCLIRNSNGLTALGIMRFDSADLANLATAGRLGDVITHEMLHVIGMGTLWPSKGLLTDSATTTPKVVGALATAACVNDHGGGGVCPGYVPAENCLDLNPGTTCGAGTRNAHWKESTFRTELMTGYAGTTNPLAKMSVQGLADLGYQVNVLVADPYTVPPPTFMSSFLYDGRPPSATTEVELPEPARPRFAVDGVGRIRRLRY